MSFPAEGPPVALDLARCPLCGADNCCAMQAAAPLAPSATPEPCWCTVTTIAPGVLERLPAAQRGQACICARCARG